MIDLTSTLNDVTFDSLLMNAAGVYCMTSDELLEVARSKAGTFVTKTATLVERPGNPTPRYHDFGKNSINSMGLPNHGLEYYLAFLKSESEEDQKKRFLSMSPMAPGELLPLLEGIKQADFKGFVELNLSCPNIPGKPQTAYDFEQTDRILEQTFTHYHGPLGVKLPPYFDMVHFDQVAEILNRYPLTFINSINSLGNGLVIEENSTTIAPKDGFGGIGGPTIKPFALANVHAFYKRLNPEIKIIGTGGVTTGRDVYEHVLAGASMVQIGTALHQEGPAVFERLLNELKLELERNGFSSLAQARGKLEYQQPTDK